MIRVEELSVHVGDFRLEGVGFEIPSGAYATLMGETGSGKTTILECLCGLRAVDSGKIFLDGRDVTRLRPADRGLGYVPQDGALFTTMTVRQHLEFPLRIRKWKWKRIKARTDELAELLNIENILGRRPAGLSGGESQRVALGRALTFHPSTLILDEPLSALDERTRQQMYGLLKEVQRHTGVTAMHITHSRQEARHLADIFLALEDGKVRRSHASSSEISELKQAEESHWP